MKRGVKYVLPSIDHNSYKGFIFVATIGLLQTAGTMGLLYIAMSLGVSSSMSAVLLFTNPLWLAVLAHFILKERLTMIKVVCTRDWCDWGYDMSRVRPFIARVGRVCRITWFTMLVM